MRIAVALLLAVLMGLVACGDAENPLPAADVATMPEARPGVVEDRFAQLALSCVHQEYPNKISHVLSSDADARTPRELTPAFYGCFDWHSSVHGHWLLVRLLKLDAETPFRDFMVAALRESFTEENITAEITYYLDPNRKSFERPYGIAWFLQLVAELHESDDDTLQDWRQTLAPLETEVTSRIKAWLPNLIYPIRLGTHNQSAFAFGLMLDYARTVGDSELEQALVDKTLAFHRDDTNCPVAYEPSGEDFLSPCLMEADLMRRVLSENEFAVWLALFLPTIPSDGSGDWLAPGVVKDAEDGKLVHLDGVNLSRAWALEGIAAGLPESDSRRPALMASAALHLETGIAAVSDEHYSGSHWLGSFATYLVTKRGIN